MAGIAYKEHIQSVASDTWEIEHGPDLRTVLDVIVNNAVVQPTSITRTTNELLTLVFATPVTGKVRLLPWAAAVGVIPQGTLYTEDDVALQLETEEYLELDE